MGSCTSWAAASEMNDNAIANLPLGLIDLLALKWMMSSSVGVSKWMCLLALMSGRPWLWADCVCVVWNDYKWADIRVLATLRGLRLHCLICIWVCLEMTKACHYPAGLSLWSFFKMQLYSVLALFCFGTPSFHNLSNSWLIKSSVARVWFAGGDVWDFLLPGQCIPASA